MTKTKKRIVFAAGMVISIAGFVILYTKGNPYIALGVALYSFGEYIENLTRNSKEKEE
jgi:hypothetical protein